MKTEKYKNYVIQQFSNNDWFFVAEDNNKNEAISLLKYKKKIHKPIKFRLMEVIVSKKKLM